MVGAGAYYVAQWLLVPISIVFWKFTSGIIYRGDFAGYVVMPLVVHLPQAVVAAVAGAIVVWLVESDRPVRWAVLPALLYAVLGFYNHHWSQPPRLLDRVSETIAALFPALACVVGGLMVARDGKIP